MTRVTGLLSLAAGILLAAGCQSVPPQEPGIASHEADRLAVLHTQLGIGYMREGKNELAYNRLQRALEIDPNYSSAHNAMALLEERLNDPQRAEAHYRRAIELNPMDSAAQNNFGTFLCRHGRVEEAEQHFLQAVKNPLYETPEAAYANAGQCMQTAGRKQDAEKYLRKALEINPRIPSALLAMAELSYEADETLSARGYLQRYLEVGPKTAQALWLGIRIERTLGDRNAVSSYAMLLKANYPDSRETALLRESETQ